MIRRFATQKIIGLQKPTSIMAADLPAQAAPAAQTQQGTNSSYFANNKPYSTGASDLEPLFKEEEETFATFDDFQEVYGGLETKRFSDEAMSILSKPLDVDEIQIRPDGLLYLPEIRYRMVLNDAFGPGNWKLIPRSVHYKLSVGNGFLLLRDYALICDSTFVSQARGEHDLYSMNQLGAAVECVKSNALVRCCKDLGIASELWDPQFLRKFKKENTVNTRVVHKLSGKSSYLTLKKGQDVEYPYKRA